jgi:hypothetical protein
MLCRILIAWLALCAWPIDSLAARLYIRICNRGDVPVYVAMGSDGGTMHSKTIEGWRIVEPGNGTWGSASNSCGAFLLGSTLRNYYFAFLIRDGSGRKGMVAFQPDWPTGAHSKLNYRFCVNPSDTFKRTGSTGELQTCGPNEVSVPFTWGISTPYGSTNEDGDETLVIRPRATSPIAVYVDKAGGTSEPRLSIGEQLFQSAQNHASGDYWADAERILKSITPNDGVVHLSPDFRTFRSLVAFRLGKFQEAAEFAAAADSAAGLGLKPTDRLLLAYQLHILAHIALNSPKLEEIVAPSYRKAAALKHGIGTMWGFMETCKGGVSLMQAEDAFRQALRQGCFKPLAPLKWS